MRHDVVIKTFIFQTYNHRDEDHGKCKIQWNSVKINIDRKQN